MKFINPTIFIISLCIGLFFSYITLPNSQVIYVYPTPDNIDKVQYKDEGGTCFEFNSSEVECPNDSKLIREYPMQSRKEM